MANFKEVRLTKAGRILQAKAETGTPLKLTRFKIGSGQMTWEEADVAIDLKEPRESMGITSNTATFRRAFTPGSWGCLLWIPMWAKSST